MLSFSSIASKIPVYEEYRHRSEEKKEEDIAILIDNSEDEEGESMTDLWEAISVTNKVYDIIKEYSEYSSCRLFDKLSTDELLEFMFPEESMQLSEYIEEEN
jgi:hypothetical protein